MATNANSNILASLLADARKGTFCGLQTTKVGKQSGRGAAKQTFGDDRVHVVFYSGFKYNNLVQRSLDALPSDATLRGIFVGATLKGIKGWSGRGKKAVQVPLTYQDFVDARADLKASFERTLAGTNKSTTDHVFEPLSTDGNEVRGSRVYRCVADDTSRKCRCRACTGDPKAPLDGTIQIQGLKIWSKVLIPAANGPIPKSKSGGKVVAKRLVRRLLPVAHYVSYRLEPGTDFLLNAGGTAKLKAETNGFQATAEVLAVLDQQVA
jgi:hypothetical protein